MKIASASSSSGFVEFLKQQHCVTVLQADYLLMKTTHTIGTQEGKLTTLSSSLQYSISNIKHFLETLHIHQIQKLLVSKHHTAKKLSTP